MSTKRRWFLHSKMPSRWSGPEALPQTPLHPHTPVRPPSDLSNWGPYPGYLCHLGSAPARSKPDPSPKTSTFMSNTIQAPESHFSKILTSIPKTEGNCVQRAWRLCVVPRPRERWAQLWRANRIWAAGALSKRKDKLTNLSKTSSQMQ